MVVRMWYALGWLAYFSDSFSKGMLRFLKRHERYEALSARRFLQVEKEEC